ncbi:translation initiation factor eIF-2B subunit gamma-like isoform X2 [Uloborus diversus]|nr:translation initiation factor eIF-2B subunit gamma-like isoform X2 [Uloborus diversus]
MEFQAVVMAAGTGSRMRELTSSIPKCLLPIGNVPLILCSLNLLKKAGFTEAIILVRENEKNKIQNAIENKIDMKLDIVAVPKNEDWGTADSLRYVKSKIKSDVLVLSCDIVSDFDLKDMLFSHRSKHSSLTMLLVPFPNSLREIEMPGYKKKCKFERDIIGLDSTDRLIFINSEADFEDGVPLKLALMKKNPLINIFSNLMDAHVYIIKRDLVQFIVSNEHISTLKGEFLPVAVKQQFTSKKRSQGIETNDGPLGKTILNKEFIDLDKLALELSSWRDPSNYSKSCMETEERCFAYIDKVTFCYRINTLVAYANINRKLMKYFTSITGTQPKSHQYQKSQVDANSILGENCELLVKSSVKQSVVGNNAKLSEKAKIHNTIVMESVQIGKDCVVQNSIICNHAVIEDACSLKNCIIGPEQIVKTSSKLNSEILQCSDQLMEI